MVLAKYWKVFTFVPLVALILASIFLANNMLTKGSFMERSPELIGGKIITLHVSDPSKINVDYNVRTTSSQNVIIEIPFDVDEKVVIDTVQSQTDIIGQPSIQTIGPVIGEIFWQQAQIAIVLAFVLMSIVVFILFRSPAPSLIVILAAVTDIVVTIALLDIIGVKLSLHVLAALLMIIGYSVDTDIVLTTNVLRGGTVRNAMKTGLTMSAAALAAFFAMYVLAGSLVLQEMALVIMLGIVIDIPATYLTNAGILRLWMERKHAGS